MPRSFGMLSMVRELLKDHTEIPNLLASTTRGGYIMFFKHVELHKYDLTNAGIDQACYDELVADGNNSTEEQLWVLAADMREKFKDYMRPLFS